MPAHSQMCQRSLWRAYSDESPHDRFGRCPAAFAGAGRPAGMDRLGLIATFRIRRLGAPIQPVGLRHRSDATARRQIPAGSYDAALQRLDLSDRYPPGRLRDNNWAENSHLSIRRRERKMRGLKGPASAQRFLETHASVYNTFNMQQHLLSRRALRVLRVGSESVWNSAVALPLQVCREPCKNVESQSDILSRQFRPSGLTWPATTGSPRANSVAQ